MKGWEQIATSDARQVEEWWAKWPEANIGVHADGLVVLDVDPKKGGYESLAALEKEIELEATYEVATPSSGRHIYYRAPVGSALRNGVDILGPGIDIRTQGGYVVGAGSVTGRGNYEVYVDEPIANADGALVVRLGTAKVSVERSERSEDVVVTDTEAAVLRACDYLRTHPVAVQGQGGDHHTFRTVCRLRDFGVPATRAAEALHEWNARCVPPWEPGELEIKIANAYAYAQDAPGKLTPEAMGFEVVEPERSQKGNDSTQNESAPKVELAHPADVDEVDVLRIAYHVKGVLEKQTDAVLFGTWNVGKTFVVLDMLASIACGLPWFGRRVNYGRVLYIGYEGIRALRKRIWALRGKYPGLNDRKTPFRWHAMTEPLTLKAGVDELGAILAKFAEIHGGPPDLIAIDTLAAALGGDDSDAQKMSDLNRLVKALIKRQGCTVLRVHHTGHGNQDRARGHSMLPAGIDTEIRVDRQEIALTKQRDDVKSTVYYKLKEVVVGKDTDGDAVKTCVVEQIEKNPLSPELTDPQREFLDRLVALRGEGGIATQTDIRDCAEDMTATERRELIRVLERKQYLRVQGKGYTICERGPMSMFDEEK